MFDLVEHCFDIRRRALVPASFFQHTQFDIHRLPTTLTRLPQGLANPFGHCHAILAGGSLERPVFVVIE
ncbi:MAG: hypothetical protein OXI66_18095 [Boseongicola sp.]|nr:hypothetical protein [Boseongicola sp.]